MKKLAVKLLLMPSKEYQVTAMVDFGTKVLGTQNATLNTLSDFKNEICRFQNF